MLKPGDMLIEPTSRNTGEQCGGQDKGQNDRRCREDGCVKPGDALIEPTSGNTGEQCERQDRCQKISNDQELIQSDPTSCP